MDICVKVKYLKYVVDFLYFGEVNIYQEDLNDFLEIAEELQLNGITKDTNNKFNSSPQTNNQLNDKHFQYNEPLLLYIYKKKDNWRL